MSADAPVRSFTSKSVKPQKPRTDDNADRETRISSIRIKNHVILHPPPTPTPQPHPLMAWAHKSPP
ncbi:hypothetical protein EYF80_024484 [Liparis tanakae]|uniref:Uncharacterized protein n=1 Tax=Liparis tanakae TaxID=230148 RepID=A0A4Z2HHG0_9TELE|nr:hypothetical protein EYF80_024484 [Liparis tanakae]